MNSCFSALLTPQVVARARWLLQKGSAGALKDTEEVDKAEDETQSACPEIDLRALFVFCSETALHSSLE